MSLALENELSSLKGKKDEYSVARVAELEKEIKFVNKSKEAYVKAHPDERDKVFGRPRRLNQTGGAVEEEEKEGKKDERLYDEQGRLKDPTRSFYYDPVYNPWGAPPPGMPYRIRGELDPGRRVCGQEGADVQIMCPSHQTASPTRMKTTATTI